jgi:hypothetical protein
MKTIWKFPIQITSTQPVEMPRGATIIHVGLDPTGTPCLWAIVDPKEMRVWVDIFIYGTGHPFKERGDPQNEFRGIPNEYIGSFNQEQYVWHVFQ